ncbi:MAG: rRNA maturation RNase YbeY [Clostridia bacterium]|nr:rRNA maturation RNase YbeY [Clostridia bacterium]
MIHLVLNEEAAAQPKELTELIKRCIEKTLESEDFPFDAEVSLSIVDAESMQTINREQRQIDRVTDVLSFPMLSIEDGVLLVEDEDIVDDYVFLGDIVICYSRACEQAEAYGHSIEREIGFLTVHSTLHLLGYDHEEGAQEESEMFAKQEAVLQSLQLFR